MQPRNKKNEIKILDTAVIVTLVPRLVNIRLLSRNKEIFIKKKVFSTHTHAQKYKNNKKENYIYRHLN